MHKVNAGLTVLARLRPDRVAAARALLAELHEHQERLPFEKSPTTHFATITVMPAQPYADETLPPLLLFATSYCGPKRAHLDELVELMGGRLREVFAHCEGFDPACSDAQLAKFMRKNRSDVDLFYSGMQGLSRADVVRHRALRDAIEGFLDDKQVKGELATDPEDVRAQIQKFVLSRPDLQWAREPEKRSAWAWLVFHWRSLLLEAAVVAIPACWLVDWLFVDHAVLTIASYTGAIAAGVFAVLVLGLFLAIVFDEEPKQTYISERPSDERAHLLAATQRRPVINEFTLGGPIKEPGKHRPLFLRILLWVLGRVADGLPGLRGTVDIPTVATARWMVSDGGKRLMFISNYTNEGKAYVRDFIETPDGAQRINLSFGFGLGFPKTRRIYLDGAATDPNTYLYSLAENQQPTLFWFGPYHDISIDNIKVNRRIRDGLFADLDKEATQQWLHLL